MAQVLNSKKSKYDFPQSLEGFGYRFNENGQLRKVDTETKQLTDSLFDFNVKPNDSEYNQKHYEALGEAITDYVYEQLEARFKLTKIAVPADNTDSTFVFASNDYETNDKLIIIIHGNGVVRAGQWARRLIINDNLESGTQFYYIDRAIKEGYAVIVTNTNDNERIVDGKRKRIEGSENPLKHMIYVWEHFVENAAAKYVAIVAHSYGGVCVLEMAKAIPSVRSKVFAIALTDSVHSMEAQSIPAKVRDFLKTRGGYVQEEKGSKLMFIVTIGMECGAMVVHVEIKQVAQNWCASREPLDTPVKTASYEIKRVSAGHTVHEMTSHACRESVFAFVDKKLLASIQAK